jgi:hypothetical protein
LLGPFSGYSQLHGKLDCLFRGVLSSH